MNTHVIISNNDVRLTEAEAQLWNACNWLNDACISFYLWTLRNKVGSEICLLDPGTVFILLFDDDPEDIQDLVVKTGMNIANLIVIPINDNLDVEDPDGGSHWALLLARRAEDGLVFEYVDSMDSQGTENVAKEVSRRVWSAMKLQNKTFKTVQCQKQTNSFDCGVYVLAYAEEAVKAEVDKRAPKFTCDADVLRKRVLDQIDMLR
jgi:sentrin-specific protease 8